MKNHTNKHMNHEANIEKKHEHHDHHVHMMKDFKKRFWICILITIPVLFLSPTIQNLIGLGDSLRFTGDRLIAFSLSAVIYFYGGWPFLVGTKDDLLSRRPGMMTLIGVAITTAFVYSSAVVMGLPGKTFFWELATLIDVMLIGHFIEMKSVMGASRALEEIIKFMPSDAHRIDSNGNITDLPIEKLMVGDNILVKPGEKIPADGSIIEGETTVDESLLTGESTPVFKKAGDDAIGGSINGEGSITVEVSKTGKDSFLSQVVDMVREAQESKSKTQDLANRAALVLTVLALSLGALTLVLWITLSDQDFAFALERTVTVMVITCPHALGLAIPLVVAVSTSLAAKNGFMIRNRTAFENARNIDTLVFDKAGTLTEGRFGVSDIITFSGKYSESEIVNHAASVETYSEHPIARGIVNSAEKVTSVKNFISHAGKGVEGKLGSKKIEIASPKYLDEKKLTVSDPRIKKLNSQGKTVVYVIIDGQLVGAIALTDIVRNESREAITVLKQMDIECFMLTGDKKEVAQWVSDDLALDGFIAEVLPKDKQDRVREIQKRGKIVAMTGDGVNDAPALAQADVGIAVGAGTDVAIETADIILVRSNPMDVAAVIRLARLTYKKMLQNLIWATGYNVLAIPLAAGVLYKYGIILSPAVGAALMSLSTVIVAINAGFLRIK